MDSGSVLHVLALLLGIEAVCMLPSLGWGLYYGESDVAAFALSIGLILLVAVVLYWIAPKGGVVRYREGFLIVGLGWLLVSLFGSLPYVFHGTFDSVIDAFFEGVSGFSTTGATVLVDIESQPHGILFWRALTNWLGGMGILVLTLAILPALGTGSFQIFQSESPGPTPGRLVPRVGKTARILYGIYLMMSLGQVIALKLAGMSWFDALTHTFATMGTGGFSNYNASLGAFSSPMIRWVIGGFMVAAGVNFALYYEAIHGQPQALWRDEEFRLYLLLIVVATGIITTNITPLYPSVVAALRHGGFQVVSTITSTGFVITDYDQWPDLSRVVLFLLMLVGGSAGSASGGIKVIRVLILLKYVRRTVYRLIHPNAVMTLRVGDQVVSEDTLHNVVGFFLIYQLLLAVFSMALVTQGMDLVSALSAATASLSNIGPGFGLVGPATTYAGLSDWTKITLSMGMILGRLEIYTILVLFSPVFWHK